MKELTSLAYPRWQDSFSLKFLYILSAPASSASVERLFSSVGKMHDDLKKNVSEETLESQLKVCLNYPYA